MWKHLGTELHEVLFESELARSNEVPGATSSRIRANWLGRPIPRIGLCRASSSYSGALEASNPALAVGRFVNATDALIWIDWSGPYNVGVLSRPVMPDFIGMAIHEVVEWP